MLYYLAEACAMCVVGFTQRQLILEQNEVQLNETFERDESGKTLGFYCFPDYN